MGFSVLTTAEQQSNRVKHQKAGLRGLQYTNEHKTEGFQHVKVLQTMGTAGGRVRVSSKYLSL